MSENPGTISHRDAVSPAVIAPIDMVYAQTSDFATHQAAMEAANSKPGPRVVPARVLPVPGDLDPATAALVATCYGPFWNLSAPDDAGWRAIVKQFDDATVPLLAQARAALGVTIEPTIVGGVKAFILTPREDPGRAQEPARVELPRRRLHFRPRRGGHCGSHADGGIRWLQGPGD